MFMEGELTALERSGFIYTTGVDCYAFRLEYIQRVSSFPLPITLSALFPLGAPPHTNLERNQ